MNKYTDYGPHLTETTPHENMLRRRQATTHTHPYPPSGAGGACGARPLLAASVSSLWRVLVGTLSSMSHVLITMESEEVEHPLSVPPLRRLSPLSAMSVIFAKLSVVRCLIS